MDVDHSAIPTNDPEVTKDLTVSIFCEGITRCYKLSDSLLLILDKTSNLSSLVLKLKETLVLLGQKRKEFVVADLNENDLESQKKEMETRMGKSDSRRFGQSRTSCYSACTTTEM